MAKKETSVENPLIEQIVMDEVDGKTVHGKIIEIIMIDGVKYKIHMTKKGTTSLPI